MPRGRKAAPTAVKILKGTQPCRVNPAEPEPARGRPERPPHLGGAARDEWDRLVPVLERMGVLTEADGAALAIYCEAFARKREAEGQIELHGLLAETATGGLKANPAVAIAAACDATMLRVLASFGLDPSSRGKVKVDKPEGPKDKLAAFKARRKKA